MRAVLCVCILAGCVHWVRADDPSEIHDERVRVVERNGFAVEIDHGCGTITMNGPPGESGGSGEHGASGGYGASCEPVDPTRQRVYVRRTDGWKTVAIASIATAVTAIVSMSFGFAIALADANRSTPF